jgi:hypothetical protein
MKNVEAAFRRLEQANPEPDPNALLQSIGSPTDATEWSNTMPSDLITIDTTESPSKVDQSRRKWISAAVAVAATALVFAVIPGGPESPYADLTDAQIAQGIVTDDIRSPSEVVHPNATFTITGYGGGYENIDRYAEFTRRTGVENTDVTCSGEGTVVCTWLSSNTISRALGTEPAPASNRFEFEDGLVTAWSGEPTPQWNDFFTWLSDEAAATMFEVNGGNVTLLLDDAALDAWEENVNAFANELAAQAEALNPNEITTALLEGNLEDPSRHIEPGFTWTESTFTGDAEDVTAWTQWVKAIGHQNENVNCSTGTAVIRCTWHVTTMASRALGLEPYTGYEGTYFFNSDNRITAISVGSSDDRLIAEFWTPFMQWLPSDRVSVMFADLSDDSFVPSLTDESIALWEESVNEWVATLEG